MEAIEKELIAHFFPGGQKEIEFKADEVRKLSNGRLSMAEAFQVYFYAKKRLTLTQEFFNGTSRRGFTGEQFITWTRELSNGKLSVSEAASILFYIIFDKIDPSNQSFHSVNECLAVRFGSDGVGCDGDVIPIGLGEFGFEPTNPVPVRGTLSNKIYLESLRTGDGRKISYDRAGSLRVPNVDGAIDEYDISQDGRPICKLYICPYHQRISSRPPKGFILVTVSPA